MRVWSLCVASLGALATLSASVLLAATTPAKVYDTDFNATENPISESGVWSHTGTKWTKVATDNGMAHGTETGSPSQPRANHYDDSYAMLSGFGADQSSSAVLYKTSASIDGSCSHEWELLLHWSDDANNARGYELNLAYDGGYAQIMRWNGPYGDFTEIGAGSFRSVKDGDVIQAKIVGNVITLSVNGTTVATATDSTFPTGNPGIGFFRGDCGSNTDIGFKSFHAESGVAALTPMPPTNVSAH